MTEKEEAYLEMLQDVMNECGLDYEEMRPSLLAKQGWDESMAFDSETGDRTGNWWDAHISMLTDAYKGNWSPEQVQKYAVEQDIWPAPELEE
jgi:hypothetical protein